MPMKKIFKLLVVAVIIGASTPGIMAQGDRTQTKPLPSWAPDKSCMQEYEKTTQHSARCKAQLEYAKKRMQEESKKCNDAMQKIYSLCGTGKNANEACYKKHRPDLEAACNGM